MVSIVFKGIYFYKILIIVNHHFCIKYIISNYPIKAPTLLLIIPPKSKTSAEKNILPRVIRIEQSLYPTFIPISGSNTLTPIHPTHESFPAFLNNKVFLALTASHYEGCHNNYNKKNNFSFHNNRYDKVLLHE